MSISKIIHQIWVGNLPRPKRWMDTWKEKHPTWEYILWDNEKVFGRRWKNQRHINVYRRRGVWHGVADIVRYEILYEYGGIMPGADSECLQSIDELFDNDYEAFAVNTGERYGKQTNPEWLGATAPLYGCAKGNVFAKQLIDEIGRIERLLPPHKSTGNMFMMEMIKKYNPRIKIFPLHYFVPEHYMGFRYEGKDKIYAKHYWGTTLRKYGEGI